tara:strand:+ start:2875 stop:3306 length:432 start_codon:yes stop_codon:yes gene_type:complete
MSKPVDDKTWKEACKKTPAQARDIFIEDMRKLWNKLDLSVKPTDDQLREMVEMCTTTRGRFRFLRRPRKGPSNKESVLFERLRWHRVIPGSTGWLGSAINSTWMVDENTFDMLDTFATLISMAQGRTSWTDEWSRVLGLDKRR